MRQIILDHLEFSKVGKHLDDEKLVSISEIIVEVKSLSFKLEQMKPLSFGNFLFLTTALG
jgi:hypothetical protein